MRRSIAKECLTLALGLALSASSAIADSEIYKWTDEEGNVHYSDCPPPPSCDAEKIEAESAPDPSEVRKAQQRLDKMLQIAVARKKICIRARQNLHVLLVQRPVFYIDENGQYVYLDEETRLAEIERMRQLIADNCEPIAE